MRWNSQSLFLGVYFCDLSDKCVLSDKFVPGKKCLKLISPLWYYKD